MDLYEKIEELGKGSNSQVFKVLNSQDNKFYALKIIDTKSLLKQHQSLSTITSQENSKNFHNEIQILSRIKHPNIVKLYDTFSITDHYLVLEYCEDGNLLEHIHAVKEFIKNSDLAIIPEYTIALWFTQLADAIHYIHSKRILHRDIKPQNIFLTDSKTRVVLGDFGISISIHDQHKKVWEGITPNDTMIGTPNYLSPEISLGRPYGPKSDIWALGCLTYELCCLESPFASNNLADLFSKIRLEDINFNSIPYIQGRYSSDLLALIKWMLQKFEGQRPDAKQLLQCGYVKKWKEIPPLSLKDIGIEERIGISIWKTNSLQNSINIGMSNTVHDSIDIPTNHTDGPNMIQTSTDVDYYGQDVLDISDVKEIFLFNKIHESEHVTNSTIDFEITDC